MKLVHAMMIHTAISAWVLLSDRAAGERAERERYREIFQTARFIASVMLLPSRKLVMNRGQRALNARMFLELKRRVTLRSHKWQFITEF